MRSLTGSRGGTRAGSSATAGTGRPRAELIVSAFRSALERLNPEERADAIQILKEGGIDWQ